MNIHRIKKICDEINAADSKAKIAVLRKYATNNQWTDFLMYQFGRNKTRIRQGKMSMYKPQSIDELKDVPYYPYVTGSGADLLEYLAYCGPGGIKQKALVAWKSILNQPAELQEFLVDGVCRNVEIKVTPRQINIVYGPDTVDDLQMMKAVSFFGREHLIRERTYTIRPIVDGLRCVAVKENGETRIYSRHGIMLEGFDQITDEFDKAPYDNTVFDGVIAYEGFGSVDMKGFDLAFKAINTARSLTADKKDFVFYIYDVVDAEEFRARDTVRPFKDRREFLETNFVDGRYIKLVRSIFRGIRISNIIKYYKQEVAAGKTGIYVNLDYEPYALKNQAAFFKVSELQDADLMIMDYELDDDKRQLKNIIVDFKDSRIKVGMGFTNEEREWFYNNAEDLIGRIATVTFLMIKQKMDGSGYWLPGVAFGELMPLGSPIRYNIKQYGVTIDDE